LLLPRDVDARTSPVTSLALESCCLTHTRAQWQIAVSFAKVRGRGCARLRRRVREMESAAAAVIGCSPFDAVRESGRLLGCLCLVIGRSSVRIRPRAPVRPSSAAYLGLPTTSRLTFAAPADVGTHFAVGSWQSQR
jgi:hypothetical protein